MEEIMRIQCEKPVTVRGKVLGGPIPLICLPLVATDQASLISQAKEVAAFAPDMIEWRIDKFDVVDEIPKDLAALSALRDTIGEIPLILTCRIITEGGFQKIPQEVRLKLNLAAIQSGQVDLLDTELSNGDALARRIKEACSKSGVKLILSYHDFEKTPDSAFIQDCLIKARDLGADVAKVAVMPKSYQDVLTLLGATYTARTEKLDIPIVTMSMGEIGAITRIAGGLFGSDLTFAVGKASSAPGQIPIGDLKTAWRVIPGYC
jgi:3-dehydroquinate dehydratase I